MSSTLVSALHHEERAIIAELRASRQFQRLEGVRKLLSLYDAQPSVSIGIEGLGGHEVDRAAAPLRMVSSPPPMSSPAPMAHAASQPIPMPGPTLAMSEAPVSEPPRTVGGEAHGEAASVVSSVRAALLGIGKA